MAGHQAGTHGGPTTRFAVRVQIKGCRNRPAAFCLTRVWTRNTPVVTVDKADLVQQIGTLPPARVREIIDGIRLVIEPRDLSGRK